MCSAVAQVESEYSSEKIIPSAKHSMNSTTPRATYYSIYVRFAVISIRQRNASINILMRMNQLLDQEISQRVDTLGSSAPERTRNQ
jgi:hypothetical protein